LKSQSGEEEKTPAIEGTPQDSKRTSSNDGKAKRLLCKKAQKRQKTRAPRKKSTDTHTQRKKKYSSNKEKSVDKKEIEVKQIHKRFIEKRGREREGTGKKTDA
jgi:hypothetical protein